MQSIRAANCIISIEQPQRADEHTQHSISGRFNTKLETHTNQLLSNISYILSKQKWDFRIGINKSEKKEQKKTIGKTTNMEKNRDQENFMETDDHMAKECYTGANISLLELNKKKKQTLR